MTWFFHLHETRRIHDIPAATVPRLHPLQLTTLASSQSLRVSYARRRNLSSGYYYPSERLSAPASSRKHCLRGSSPWTVAAAGGSRQEKPHRET